MKSEELADEVVAIIDRCRERIMGTGNKQYSEGDTQRFERLPLKDLFQYAYEEIEDYIVYSAMLHIRLRRLQKKVDERIEHLKGLDCL